MERETIVNDRKSEVLTTLKNFYPQYQWVYEDFKQVLDVVSIKKILDTAYTETAVRNYINKHGIEHGLTAALNILHLFRPIEEDIITSDYIALNEGCIELRKEHVLFTLLVAAYIHDVGRFYDPSIDHVREVFLGIEIINGLASPPANVILGGASGEVVAEIIRRIRELCLCHERKEEKSGKVEIALIKLADALDCSKDRVYSVTEKPKEFKADYPERMRTIFSKDNHPEEYFGPKSIDEVDIKWIEQEDVFEITLLIENYAASVPIKRILKILTQCEQGPESVQKLSRKIRVYIREKQDPQHYYILYPEDIVLIPYAKIINHSVIISTTNIDGDVDIKEVLEIKNLKDRSGISSHTKALGGRKKTSWEELDKKIKFTDSNGRQLDKLYKYSEHNPETGEVAHLWAIIFKDKLRMDDTLKIGGTYTSWPGFLNIEKDMYVRKIRTPCDHFEVKIIFPQGENIKQEKVKACIEIKNSKNVLYHKKNIPASLTPEGKVYITFTFDSLQSGYSYIGKWELVNTDIKPK